jgi:hypothetical protein
MFRRFALLPLLLLPLWSSCLPEGGPHGAVWQTLERTLPIAVDAANPFDPGEVAVDAELADPDGGVQRVPAFVYQPYERSVRPDGRETLTPVGEPEWRLRFTPTRPGAWRWRWVRTTPAGSETGPWQQLVIAPNLDPARHGFVRRSPDDARYLEFDDGTPFFAVGENLAWYDQRGSRAYEDWIPKLAASGANYIRLWMPSWAMGLVYPPATLEDWSARLDRAWQLDRVIELARKHGLYVMLSVQNHGPFELGGFFGSGWDANLFNAANGGPLGHPGEFHESAEAREIFRRYLRYVVARWGHSPNVLCFELWNEVDLTEQPDSIDPVVDWHREMAGWLRELDPNDHLISTSTSDELMTLTAWLGNFPMQEFPLAYEPVWQLPEIDFVQLHSYQIWGWNVRAPVADTLFQLADRMAQYGKPVLVAEAGVDFRGIAETLQADPEGEGFHDIVWAGAFAGTFGSGMSWWWDFVVDTENWYFHFEPLSRLVARVDFPREQMERSVVPVDAPGRDVAAHLLAGRNTVLGWVKNLDHEYYRPDRTPVAGGSFVVPLRGGGKWWGQWIDPWTGAQVVRFPILPPAGQQEAALSVPTFSRDLALRLDRVQVPPP